LWLVFILASARILGPEAFGLYALATVIVSIVFIVFEAGIDVTAMKRLSTTSEPDPALVNLSLYSKWLILSGCGFLVWIGSWVMDAELATLVRMAIPIAILQFGVLFMRHLYRGHVWFEMEAKSIVTERGASILFGSVALWWSADVIHFMIAFVAAYLVVLLADWHRFRSRSRHRVSFPGLRPVLRHIRTSASIGLYHAFSVLFTRVSSIVMHIGGLPAADIGRFNSGIRLFDSFALLPTILSDPLYPRICASIQDRDALTGIIRFPAVFLFTVTTLAAGLLLTHHETIIGWVLGDAYRVASLEIALVFSTIVMFSQNTITTKLIIAAEKERLISKILGVLLVSQVAFLVIALRYGDFLTVVAAYVAHEVLFNLILGAIAYRHVDIARLVRDLGWVGGAAVASAWAAAWITVPHPVLSMLIQAGIMGALLIAAGIYRLDHLTRLWTHLRSWARR